ncbi:hypothetical protein CTA2_7435 [Colletotrichum tanaceti]|uniref:RRM domain-containing protein n=1 Tax=Colletotrichum tanaceti TaxID=1306861 RepID=A0A4U6XJ98_9PEZI|nr:hypothetical protein CTA2_7435 [Colletotrichum tanaceti]TKW55613.1 hypothetical protein CTA1_13291 [Colletotrichum tanaceti]
MVDRIDSYPPGRVMDQPQDDDSSTIYVSTDNGWTNDDDSDAGSPIAPALPPPVLSRSESQNLIDFDFSDNGDHHDGNGQTDKLADVMDHISCQPSTEDQSTKVQLFPLDPSSEAQSDGNLNPAAVEFTPSNSCSFPREQISPLSSSRSSFADALQSLDSSDDKLTLIQARVKQLEYDYETLKREKGRVDKLNEELRYNAGKNNATIERLTAQLSEAELLRCRAQRYASEISERGQLDKVSLTGVGEDLNCTKAQLESLRAKYDRVVQSQVPLQNQVQELQTGLLNAVERNKTYEAFLRSFLADHPQHVAAFGAIGVSPSNAERENNCVAGNVEADLLLSFEEISPTSAAPSKPLKSHLLDDTVSVLESERQPASEDAASMYSCLEPIQKSSPQAPQQLLLQAPVQPDVQENHHCLETSRQPDTCNVEVDDLKWSSDCDDLWESPSHKQRALRNQQGGYGARQRSQTPGMFLYGIRYVRDRSDQTLITGNGISEVASRMVIMSGFPDEVHVQRVLEHVRGGRILNAHVAPMGTGDFTYNQAFVEFTAAEDASAFYRYARCRKFGFIGADGDSVSVHTSIPTTDSYPLNEAMQTSIDEGCTRCLVVTGFSVVHLEAVLKKAGLAYNFAEVITYFTYSDDGDFEISFSSLRSAILVRQYILGSSLGTDGRSVTFRSDPCDGSLDELQVPFLPVYPTVDLSILAPENARRFMTTEERKQEEERLQAVRLEACDPNDPETDSLKEMLDRKSIVWEKTPDWEKAVEYVAYDPNQRKEVRHRKDRESGAVQMWYHGGWAMTQTESWKAWEHHNFDSPEPYTQKTADLLYKVTGWVDRRKVNLYLKTKMEKEKGGENGNTDNDAGRLSSTTVESTETLNNL